MLNRVFLFGFGLILMITMSGAAKAASFVSLGVLPGGNRTVPQGISGNGEYVVGFSRVSSESHAFLWDASTGNMQSLGRLDNVPAGDSFGYAVTNDGLTVVGESSYAGHASRREGFVQNGATNPMVGVGFFGVDPIGTSSTRAVSADGLISVGYSTGDSASKAFMRSEATGQLVNLGTIDGETNSRSFAYGISADGNTVVGFGSNGPITEAFIWLESTNAMTGLGTLHAGQDSQALGVSADGSTVVGYSLLPTAGEREAFVWTQAFGMVGLGDLPGALHHSVARDASADGKRIVGYADSSEEDNSAFIAERNSDGETYTMHSMMDFLTASGLDLTGWELEHAYGISDDGLTITGYGIDPNLGQHVAWVAQLDPTVIPSPASSLAGLLGFSCLGLIRRRRTR